MTVNETDVELHAWPLQRYGGQHLNSASCGVLAIHVPTGLAVVSTSERSQHKNRAHAIARLWRLVAIEELRTVYEHEPGCGCDGRGPCPRPVATSLPGPGERG